MRPLHTFPDGRTTWEWVVKGPRGAIGTAFTERQAKLIVPLLNEGLDTKRLLVIPVDDESEELLERKVLCAGLSNHVIVNAS